MDATYNKLMSDAEFERELKVERLILDVADLFSSITMEMNYHEIAEKTGLSERQVQNIFAGRNLTLREIALLFHSIGVRVTISEVKENEF